MILARSVTALLFFPLISLAQNGGAPTAAPLEMTVQEGDQILVQGLHAHVTLTGAPTSTLKVKGLGDSFVFERKDGTLWIHAKESDNRKEWKDGLKEWERTKASLEISGPALPTEIHLRQGSVYLLKWNKDARVELREGSVHVAQSNGAFRLNLHKGEVVASDVGGRLNLDMYQGSVSLKQMNVDADLRLFGSSLNVDGGRGHWSVAASNANAKLAKFSGTLQLDLSKGSLSATAFQGRAEGQAGESSVTLAGLPETDVNLKSTNGRLQVSLPPATGAFLNLATMDGELVGPPDVRVNRTATEKTIRTRYRGEGSLTVTLRSQDGNIVVK